MRTSCSVLLDINIYIYSFELTVGFFTDFWWKILKNVCLHPPYHDSGGKEGVKLGKPLFIVAERNKKEHIVRYSQVLSRSQT